MSELAQFMDRIYKLDLTNDVAALFGELAAAVEKDLAEIRHEYNAHLEEYHDVQIVEVNSAGEVGKSD